MKRKRVAAACILAAVMMTETPVMAEADVLFTDTVQTEAFTDVLPGAETFESEERTEAETPEEPETPTEPETPEEPETPTEPEIPAEPEKPEKPQVKPQWEKRASGRSYWRMANGKILKTPGLHKLGGKWYCLNVGGSRVEDAWKKIDGKVYYFQKNGVKRQKQGWIEWGGNKYYTNADGSRFSGFRTVKGRLHYFDNRGRIWSNKKEVKIGDHYYDIDAKCNVTQLSDKRVKCKQETQKFIEKHTKPGMTNSQKFRACYNYLLGYMHYRPKPFNSKDFQGTDWPYNWALSVFQSGLTGNCYGFACSVASCAKELGYDPYVIVTTGDHGFVMIDGLYYDNMGALFGSGSHFAYKTLYKVKF